MIINRPLHPIKKQFRMGWQFSIISQTLPSLAEWSRLQKNEEISFARHQTITIPNGEIEQKKTSIQQSK